MATLQQFLMQEGGPTPESIIADATVQPYDSSATKEQLLAAISRQQQVIDSLHGAAKRYKSRTSTLQISCTELQSQLDILLGVKAENAELRATIDVLHRKLTDLQGTVGSMAERAVGNVDSGAVTLLRCRALERQADQLREEVNRKTSAAQTLQQELDMVKQQVLDRDERIRILLNRPRKDATGNIKTDAGALVVVSSTDQLTPAAAAELISNLKKEISTLTTQNQLYQSKLTQAHEDIVRKEAANQALTRETKALRGTISSLVSQVSGTPNGMTPPPTATTKQPSSISIGGSISPSPVVPPVVSRLRKYHEGDGDGATAPLGFDFTSTERN